MKYINTLNYKVIIDKIFLLLLILLPLSFQIGILITEILFNVSIFLSIYIFFRDKLIIDKVFFYFFVIFYLYFVVSNLINFYYFQHDVDLTKVFSYFRFFLFFLLVKEILNIEHVNKILKYNLYLICFLLLDIIFQKILGENILGYETIENRSSSFFGEELIAGSYISKICFPLIIFFYFFLDTKKRNYLILLIILLINVVIFFTGERAALFSFYVMIFFSIFFLTDLRKSLFIYLTFILITSVLIINLAPSKLGRLNEIQKTFFDKDYILKTNAGLEEIDKIQDNFISKFIYILKSSKHIYLFNTSKNIWIENKIIGSGIKTFRYECSKEKYKIGNIENLCSTHPHNYYFEILAELGIIGLLFFIYLIYLVINRYLIFYRKKLNSRSFYIYSSFFLTFLSYLFIITSGRFFSNWISIIFWLNLTLMFSFEKSFYDQLKIKKVKNLF